MKNSTIDSFVRKGVVWTTIGQIAKELFLLVAIAILARILSPSDYGLMGGAMLVTRFAKTVGDIGMQNAIVQRSTLERSHIASAFWFKLVLGLIVTTIIVVMSSFIERMLKMPGSAKMIQIVSICVLLDSVSAIPSAIIKKQLRYRSIAALGVAESVIESLVAISCGIYGLGAISLAFAYVSSSVLRLFVQLFISWRNFYIFPVTTKSFLELIKYGKWIGLKNLIEFLSVNLDIFLISRFFGSVALGIYERSSSLVSRPTQRLRQAFIGSLFPVFSKYQKDVNLVAETTKKIIGTYAAILFPICTWIACSSESICLFLLGEQWIDCSPLIKIACLVNMLTPVLICRVWLLTTGYSAICAKIAMKVMIIHCIILVIVIPFGTIGFMWGVFFSQLVEATLIIHSSRKTFDFGFLKVWNPIKPVLLCCFIQASLTSIGILYFGKKYPVALQLSFETIFGFVIYIISFSIVRPSAAWNEFIKLMSTVKNKGMIRDREGVS